MELELGSGEHLTFPAGSSKHLGSNTVLRSLAS